MEVHWHSILQLWWLFVAARTVAAGISCLSNPCQHGICLDDINSTYSCYCVDGYTGVQCQTNWDECWSDPCLNGGSCVDGIASYNCTCPEGFVGDNCETNFNECESNPCVNNGTCIDMTNGYVCSCVPGFSGQHCEVDIAVCNSTNEVRCYNGGECIEGVGFKFYCRCSAGWTGSKCEDQIDECQSSPCQNAGACIDLHADYMCACPYGFTGKNCDVQIQFCEENSCSTNALCVVEDGMRTCYCVPDFHGERCELQYNECLLGTGCMNGGTCIDGVDNFTCSCPPNLSGQLCECLVLDDGTQDCEYVSPTSLPGLISTVYDETTLFTNFVTRYNDTELRTAHSSVEIWTTAPTLEIYDTTTDILTMTDDNIVVSTETIFIEEVLATKETTSETVSVKNSETETTTDCIECLQTTNVPSLSDLGTTYKSTDHIKSLINETTTKINFFDLPETSTDATSKIDTIEGSDTTTIKMFTETPTDAIITEIPPTKTIITITEPAEITTEFHSIEHGLTTVSSDCSNSICNDHGFCYNVGHEAQCRCDFNYRGKFCEEKFSINTAAFTGSSFIAHHLKNTTSMTIEFNAQTLMIDGQIMHVDIAKDIYMQLYVNSGLLKFKFSCGYQTMLLSELKTFVNKGYSMKVELRLDLFKKEQHCNATLRINDTVAMSGGQIANITILHDNVTLYLGHHPHRNQTEILPFIGCINELVVNGATREVFNDAFAANDVTECSSLACLSTPCSNAGSCRDSEDGYTCSCSNGWMGANCNQSVCEHNPCQFGGSCIRHPGSGFLCLCPYGKHGIFCEYNLEISRPSLSPISPGISSYLVYSMSPSAINSDRFDLRMRFHTTDMEQIALIAFVGQNGKHDSKSQHIAMTFVKGYIMLTWNTGSGSRRIFTSRPLTSRRGGHSVRLWRRGRSAGFSVDGRHNVSGNAPSDSTTMHLMPYLYIGGHPSPGFHDLPHDLPLHAGWRGCIWDVGGGAVAGSSSGPRGGRGVGQCAVQHCGAAACSQPQGLCLHAPATYGCICNDGWFGPTCSLKQNPCDISMTNCKGQCVVTNEASPQCDCPYGKTGINCDQDLLPTDVQFSGIRSYIHLHNRSLSSVSLSIEAEMKPSKERGLVVYTETEHFFTSLSLQGALLEFRWTDRLSGLTSLVRSGVILSLNSWHKVKAGRYGSRIYVWVDGSLTTEAMLAHTYPHTQSNATIYLGGAKDLSELPFDVMSGPSEPFKGCIRNLHINNILLVLENQNIIDGQNVDDCDGTACGGETCIGGTCFVDGGKARCVCGAGETRVSEGAAIGGGIRCRRGAQCVSENCKEPGGRCRAGLCVCTTGYAGQDCQNRINITVPQFSGSSLLSPSRLIAEPRQRYHNQQRLGLQYEVPRTVSLNFTTADTDGLLLWIAMDLDYLGLGLERGYIKLSASLHYQNGTYRSPHSKMSTLPESSRIFSKLLQNIGSLADAEWHVLNLKISKEKITLTMDKLLVLLEEPGLDNGVKYNAVDLFIGGITEDESPLSKKIFPQNFKGCIDNISVNNEAFMKNFTDIYSENLQSCQLYPQLF